MDASGAAGGGGGGGAGILVLQDANVDISGVVRGGAGGGGGLGVFAGYGGAGGAGVDTRSTAGSVGVSIRAGASVSGGDGGAYGGAGPIGGGNGGAGIVTAGGTTITNYGSISGGLSGTGATRASAILFGGSGNTYQAGSGSSLTGNLQLDNNAAATVRGAGGSIDTGVVLNPGASLSLAGDTDGLLVSGDVSGNGSVRILGSSGLVTLTGANTYAGTTTIDSGGRLQVGDGSAGGNGSLGAGNVVNNGTLTFNRSGNDTWASNMSGTGNLAKAGAGTLVLTGTNTYSGTTAVQGGTLIVNGSSVSATTVQAGATLGGSGSVGSLTLQSGSTLSPGNLAGSLTVNGNLQMQPGSTYRVETDAAGRADLTFVTGSASVAGTVDVQAASGNYARETSYMVLAAAGGLTGRFDGVTSNLAFLDPNLMYNANGVWVLLSRNDTSYAEIAATRNQASVARYLEQVSRNPTTSQGQALVQQIESLSAAQARTAFNALSGASHATASSLAMSMTRGFSGQLAGPDGQGSRLVANGDAARRDYASLDLAQAGSAVLSDAGPGTAPAPRGLWVQALGTGGRLATDGNADGTRWRGDGLALGYEQPVGAAWAAGAALGYSRAQWDATSGSGATGRIETPRIGIHARNTGDGLRARVDASLADHDFSTDRTVDIGGTRSIAHGSHGGREWGLGLQVERPVQMGDWELLPMAALRHARLSEDGFTESGAGFANLTVQGRKTSNTVLSAGMQASRSIAGGRGAMGLRAVASYLAGDNDSPATSSIAGQAGSFTASGVPLRRAALMLGGSVQGRLSRGAVAYADAGYELRGRGQNAFQLTAGVRWSF